MWTAVRDCSVRLLIMYRESLRQKKITEENFVLESSLETNESPRYMDSTQEEQTIYNLVHTQGEISLQDRY